METSTAEVNLSDALRTIAVNGAYNASRALSKWFRRGVRLTSGGFERTPLSEFGDILGSAEEPIAAVLLPLEGDLSGTILLAFPEDVALELADIMMQAPPGTAQELGEIEQSCLQETANIVASAYANSLAQWMKLTTAPGVPAFAHDMACSVIDAVLMDGALAGDHMYVAKTDFVLEGRHLAWVMMLFPSPDSLILMEERSRTETVRSEALRTIAINGAFNASRAASKWLKRGVKLTTNGFDRMPLGDIASVHDESSPVVALRVPLVDHLKGYALLTMAESHARRLVNMLMGRDDRAPVTWDEVERSCMEETGNIIVSAYVNSWANWLDMSIDTESPQFALDLPGPIVEAVLADQATVGDDLLVARTDFVIDDTPLEFVFLLLPAPSAMCLIENALSQRAI